MSLRQVLTTKTVYVGGGGEGSTSTSDSIALYARVQLFDQINAASDTLGVRVKAAYAETNAAPTDTLGLYAKVNAADTAPAQSDQLIALALSAAEANDAPLDTLSALRLALANDTNTTPTEAITTGFAGPALSDAAPAAVDARPSITVHTWAASQASAGGGTTNGANAVGAANGTVATVTGTGLGGTSTLTLTIPVASVPTTGVKTLRCYIGFTASLATANVTFTNTGGVPASGTVPVANGATSATSTDLAITTVGTAFTVRVLVNSGALLAPSYSVDAVEIQTVSAL